MMVWKASTSAPAQKSRPAIRARRRICTDCSGRRKAPGGPRASVTLVPDLGERSVERDLGGSEQSRDRAAGFRRAGELVELRLIDVRHLGRGGEMNLRDGGLVVHVQSDARGGLE